MNNKNRLKEDKRLKRLIFIRDLQINIFLFLFLLILILITICSIGIGYNHFFN